MTNHNDIEPRIAQLESRIDSVAKKSDIENLETLRSNISSNFYLEGKRGIATFLGFLAIMLISVIINAFIG